MRRITKVGVLTGFLALTIATAAGGASVGRASGSAVPAIGVRLDSFPTHNEDSCAGLVAYDAWATGTLPSGLGNFAPCGWTSTNGANGSVTNLAGGADLINPSWQNFTGPSSNPDQGTPLFTLGMQPFCYWQTKANAIATNNNNATFNEKCANSTLTTADRGTIAKNLADDVKYWGGKHPCSPPTAADPTSEYGASPPTDPYNADNAKCNWEPYYRTVADQLIANGDGNAYIRIGAESEGNWYAWQYGPDASAWITYFNDIASAMQGEENGTALHFQFVWVTGLCVKTKNQLGQLVPPSQAWPTSATVVGLDFGSTDLCPGGSAIQAPKDPYDDWNTLSSETYGLTYWQTFAQQHNAGLALTQWEEHNDNGYFISQIYQNLIATNSLVFENYFDVDNEQTGLNNRLSPPNTTLTQPVDNTSPISNLNIEVPIAGAAFSVAAGDPIDVISPEQASSPSPLVVDQFIAAGPVDPTTSSIPVESQTPVNSLLTGAVVIDTNEASANPKPAACYQYEYFGTQSAGPACETALNSTTLTAEVKKLAGDVTQLPVAITDFSVADGDCLQLTSGSKSLTLTASGLTPAGATSIAVIPQATPVNFLAGSNVVDETKAVGQQGC